MLDDEKLLLIKEVARLWSVLDGFEQHCSELLTDLMISQLGEFRSLVLPKWPADNSCSFANLLNVAAEHTLHFIQKDDGPVVGTTYRNLSECIEEIEKSEYVPQYIGYKLEPKDDETDSNEQNLVNLKNGLEHPESDFLETQAPEMSDSDVQSITSANIEANCINRSSTSPPRRGSKRYECHDCNGKTFANKSSLIRHNRLHTGERPFVCSHCGKMFVCASNRDKHVRRRHLAVTERTKLACPMCSKTFTDPAYLQGHIRHHALNIRDGTGPVASTDESDVLNGGQTIMKPPFACEICGREFLYPSTHREHMRKHESERAFQCETCGKSFKRIGDLTVHSRFHDNKKHYRCADCGRQFTWKSGLVRHRRVHTGERPYLCVKCGRAFAGWSNHRKHMRLHAQNDVSSLQLPPQFMGEMKSASLELSSLH